MALSLKRNGRACKTHRQFRRVRLSKAFGGRMKWRRSFWKTDGLCLILKRFLITLRMKFEILTLPVSVGSPIFLRLISCVPNPVVFWLFLECPKLIPSSGLYRANSILTFKLSLLPGRLERWQYVRCRYTTKHWHALSMLIDLWIDIICLLVWWLTCFISTLDVEDPWEQVLNIFTFELTMLVT